MNRMARSNRPENLARLRHGWEEVQAEETRLLRAMTIEESLRELLLLQRAFEPQLQRTEALFRVERIAYLEDLQRRLFALDEWKKRRRGSPV
jgi:hypothetical protein